MRVLIGDIAFKLGTDGAAFVTFRERMAALEEEANQGGEAAIRLCQIVKDFHKLLEVINR